MTATHSLSVLDIKSASLDVLSLLLRSADPELLRNELSARLARRPKAFASEPFLLDVSALDDSVADALPQLCELLQSQGCASSACATAAPPWASRRGRWAGGGFRPSWNAHPRLLLNPPNPSAYPNPCLSPWRLSPSPRRKCRVVG